jgi:hypothetical protein
LDCQYCAKRRNAVIQPHRPAGSLACVLAALFWGGGEENDAGLPGTLKPFNF